MVSPEAGSIINDRYRLGRMLARGGMGSVWAARHLQLDTDVAIKFMSPEYAASPEARARFEREARSSAQLKTPNVVQVHDYGVEGDTPYIVMELLEGEDLEARLQRVGRLSLSATLTILAQVCKALRRAHDAGLVHRDLKPANLFLAREGEEEVVKILDFGIAKVNNPELAGHATKTGTLLGSPYYMSPEQVRRHKAVDHRSDLWSLGVIVFRCVTGQLPFPGEVLGDVFVEICTDPIPAASQIAKDLGPEVDTFLARALTRDPEQRFQSAGELAEAFAQVAGWRGKLLSGAELVGSQSRASAAGGALASEAGQRALPGLSLSASSASRAVSTGTLSPAGLSLALPPSRGRTAGVLLAVVGGAVALLIGVVTLLRSSAPKELPAPAATPVTSPSAATPPPAATSLEPASEPKASPPVSAPRAVAPKESPSAAASASQRPERPKTSPPPPNKPRPSHDDPRDHM